VTVKLDQRVGAGGLGASDHGFARRLFFRAIKGSDEIELFGVCRKCRGGVALGIIAVDWVGLGADAAALTHPGETHTHNSMLAKADETTPAHWVSAILVGQQKSHIPLQHHVRLSQRLVT
jgi:hypothetical protein